MSNIKFNNTTVFVIGGSSGIGRGIADSLAEANARVIVLSRTPHSSLEWRPLDLAQPNESRLQLAAAVDEFGTQLDAVFYSAIYYGSKRASFSTVTEDEWRQQINVNLHGLWLSLSLTLPILQKRTPSLFVHLSSEVVYNAGPGRSGYAATKAAASNLMRSLAQEDPVGYVRLIQLLPAKMVDTIGVRSRRPSNFDYSDYMTPQHFQQAALQLLHTRGEGMHGESWVVGDHGQLSRIDENIPVSQSHRGKP
jgi:cyclitol oxidoreductase